MKKRRRVFYSVTAGSRGIPAASAAPAVSGLLDSGIPGLTENQDFLRGRTP